MGEIVELPQVGGATIATSGVPPNPFNCQPAMSAIQASDLWAGIAPAEAADYSIVHPIPNKSMTTHSFLRRNRAEAVGRNGFHNRPGFGDAQGLRNLDHSFIGVDLSQTTAIPTLESPGFLPGLHKVSAPKNKRPVV